MLIITDEHYCFRFFFKFSFRITNDGAYYVAVRREIWGFRPISVQRHFQETDISALLFRLKPRRVEKFRECRLTDLRHSEF